MLDQLHEQPEPGHPGHVTGELIADLVRHEPDLLPLDDLPLGLLCPALHGRCMPPDIRQLVSQFLHAFHRRAAFPRLAQQPVHDEIRVSANRRRKVRVGLRRQAEVADVDRIVLRLLHGTEHQQSHRTLLGLSMQTLQELLEMPWTHTTGRRPESVSKRDREGIKIRDLGRIRRLVDAKQRRQLAVSEMTGNRLVGCQHELLDDAMRYVAVCRYDVLDHSRLVEHQLRGLEVEVDRSPPNATGVETPVHRVHEAEQRHQLRVLASCVRIASSQDGFDLGVGHARV